MVNFNFLKRIKEADLKYLLHTHYHVGNAAGAVVKAGYIL